MNLQTVLSVHVYVCTLCINSVPAPPNSCLSGQSSDAHKGQIPHFVHTTQEMNIQTKTLTWTLNSEHFQEMAYFAMILFKMPTVLYNNRKIENYLTLLPPVRAPLASHLRYLLAVRNRYQTKPVYHKDILRMWSNMMGPICKEFSLPQVLMSFTNWCPEVTHLPPQSFSFFTYKMEIIRVPRSYSYGDYQTHVKRLA